MCKAPHVSVIIPTFNRSRMVCQAVEAVLAQTFTAFELIVADDGSTDDTPASLAPYADVITLITGNTNKGVSASRNAGAARARGTYVAFLDSDDLWLPEKLNRQVAFFATHPEALICQTEEIWIKNGRRINPAKKHKKPSGMIFFPSLELCLVSPSAVMMKKSFFVEMGGFDESLPACEDYDLWLRMACRYPIHLINDPLVIKRGGHGDQLSAARGLDKFRIHSLKNLIASPHLTPAMRDAAVSVLVRKCRIYAQGCARRNRVEEAREYDRIAETAARGQ
ncbi:MAG: glycosyltransferase family A protein [Thermodesulfobacteriota bacterium]